MVYLLKMVIFYSYVKLPEGKSLFMMVYIIAGIYQTEIDPPGVTCRDLAARTFDPRESEALTAMVNMATGPDLPTTMGFRTRSHGCGCGCGCGCCCCCCGCGCGCCGGGGGCCCCGCCCCCCGCGCCCCCCCDIYIYVNCIYAYFLIDNRGSPSNMNI